VHDMKDLADFCLCSWPGVRSHEDEKRLFHCPINIVLEFEADQFGDFQSADNI
jgi:hypothetical protein